WVHPYLDVKQIPAGETATSVEWTGATSSNEHIQVVFGGKSATEVINVKPSTLVDYYAVGKTFPDHYFGGSTYGYSMTKNGVLNPAPESGTIKKSDSIKLFCDSQKR